MQKGSKNEPPKLKGTLNNYGTKYSNVDKNTVEVNNLQASRRHPCNVKKRDARHVMIELDSKKTVERLKNEKGT